MESNETERQSLETSEQWVQPFLVEPIYVNVKQYNRILKRRQKRAKLDAQNRLIKQRKVATQLHSHKAVFTRISA